MRDSRLPAWIPRPVRWLLDFLWRLLVVGFCVSAGLALLYLVVAMRYDLALIKRMPEHSVVRDLEGREIGTLHGESRRLISRQEIPPFFVQALMAREDKRFFDHLGIDYRGLARATLRNLRDRSFTQGASTLTMQLARNSFELTGKNLHRKLLEITLATRIEWEFPKDDILTAYVNRIYFGSGCHGLEEAARRYFGTSAAQLTPTQAALLAGIIRAPHTYSPRRNLQGALAQRDQVLDRMVAEQFITRPEADRIRAADLALAAPVTAQGGRPALQAIERHLEELLADQDIRQGGLELHSTIHSGIQALLESELDTLRRKLGPGLEAAGLCIHNETGGVRAIVGGDSPTASFNRALDARRDLGSLFNPFLYAIAAERGLTPYLDQPVRTGRQLERDDLVRLCRRIGLEGPFAEGDDLSRGALGVTPLELATSTATLALGGRRPRTFFIREIRAPGGHLIHRTAPSFIPALDRRATAAALAMQFPSGEPRLLAGLSPARTDLWAISCGSRHTFCLWAGHDTPQPLDDPDGAVILGQSIIERLARSLPRRRPSGARFQGPPPPRHAGPQILPTPASHRPPPRSFDQQFPSTAARPAPPGAPPCRESPKKRLLCRRLGLASAPHGSRRR